MVFEFRLERARWGANLPSRPPPLREGTSILRQASDLRPGRDLRWVERHLRLPGISGGLHRNAVGRGMRIGPVARKRECLEGNRWISIGERSLSAVG